MSRQGTTWQLPTFCKGSRWRFRGATPPQSWGACKANCHPSFQFLYHIYSFIQLDIANSKLFFIHNNNYYYFIEKKIIDNFFTIYCSIVIPLVQKFRGRGLELCNLQINIKFVDYSRVEDEFYVTMSCIFKYSCRFKLPMRTIKTHCKFQKCLVTMK